MIFSNCTVVNLSSTFDISWEVERYSLKNSLKSLIWRCFITVFLNLKLTAAAFLSRATFGIYTKQSP